MKSIHIICLAVAIFALSLIVVPSLFEIPQMGSTWRKDQKFIASLESISRIIPENESIVSSSFDPAIFYFTGRQVQVPSNVSSHSSLLSFMDRNNYSYILIIEGQYNAPPQAKFERSELNNLTIDFKEIATFNTDFSKLHLYKRI